MLNIDSFKETLKRQFKESIQMAIQESYSDYHNTLNIELLHEKITTLKRFALKDGFNPSEWDELVTALCSELYDEKTIYTTAAAA